jgi:brefeldin A-inhibited guanine nucleotide-exchange protein
MSLLRHFKPQLKAELGVFLDRVFLAIAESSNSSVVHKLAVLSCLSQICADSNALIDLFVNYDCDDSALNIFEHMCLVLENAANCVQHPSTLR